MEDQKDNNGRLDRWSILLAGTNYKIKYRPGRIHQNTDCLSKIRIASIQLQDNELKKICEIQSNDSFCIEIIKYLNNGELTPEDIKKLTIGAKEIEFYEIRNGILYRREPSTKQSKRNVLNYQVVPPLTLRPLVLKEMHDEPLAGYLACLRTYLRVKKITTIGLLCNKT